MTGRTLATNSVGDMVLDDARAMRVLANSVRLLIVDRLTRYGPATTRQIASDLALRVDQARSHLLRLQQVGLVGTLPDSGRAALWRANGKGIFFEASSHDPERTAAARQLQKVMLLQYESVPRDWVEGVEPGLEDEWAKQAGMINARPAVTATELTELQAKLEELLAPFTTRAESPPRARRIRVLAYFLPELNTAPQDSRPRTERGATSESDGVSGNDG